MNLSQMRARLRADLHDEDDNNYRWTDDALSRHIQHAARELSSAVPLQARATLIASEGSRDLPVDSLQDMVSIEAVEYPAGMYPPCYVRFSLWGQTLILLTDRTPVEGEEVRVYYGKLHTLSEETSTIPPALEELVATGAAGYAAIEWASFATNRVNLGGEDTWRNYLAWGQDRLAAFMRGLAKHSRRNALRPRRMYSPYEARDSMTTDRGPR